jgi:hypothetical protein
MGIECIFENMSLRSPDSVALLVTFRSSLGTLSIHSAEVVREIGHVEADILHTPANFDSGEVTQFVEQLTALIAPLKLAIRRGRPSNLRIRSRRPISAIGRLCCKIRLRQAAKRDSVMLTRISTRSIHDGPSEE